MRCWLQLVLLGSAVLRGPSGDAGSDKILQWQHLAEQEARELAQATELLQKQEGELRETRALIRHDGAGNESKQPPPLPEKHVKAELSNQQSLDGMMDEIFRSYNKHARPVPDCATMDCSHRIQVKMGLNFQKLVTLDQTSGFLTMVVWFRLQWPDFRLAYDSSNLASEMGWNSTSDFLAVDADKLWVPDIYLLNSVAKIEYLSDEARAYWYDENKLHQEGFNIVLNRPALITTRCDVDMTQYPFDTQNCMLRWGAWSASSIFFTFSTLDTAMSSDMPKTTEEFNVTNIRALSSSYRFKVAEGAKFPQVVYEIQLQRYGFWYLVVLIYPMIFLVMVAMSVFFLDIRSGERHSVALTLVLATMTVGFLTAERLPRSSDDMWFIRFQCGVYAFIVTCVIESCVVDYIDVWYSKQSLAPYVVDVFFQITYPWAVLGFLVYMFRQVYWWSSQRSALAMVLVIVVFFIIAVTLSLHSVFTFATSPHAKSHKIQKLDGAVGALAAALQLKVEEEQRDSQERSADA
mmetsp:Transcript_78254/g.209205  ORF Transcript_78254/g.209205 Transcript_78254/m.209205 type:complete len:519 (-) Transcript_78254:132-1688(-)